MEIDLALLNEMHPRLPSDLVVGLVGRAALALQRHGHPSGVGVSWSLEQATVAGHLSSPVADLGKVALHDHNRITEDGAEAVALAMIHQHRGCRVVRRMQREESADWLLERRGPKGRQLVALEVSGVDRGSIHTRLAEKLKQVSKSLDVDQRWAGVVGFEEPTAGLQPTKRGGREN